MPARLPLPRLGRSESAAAASSGPRAVAQAKETTPWQWDAQRNGYPGKGDSDGPGAPGGWEPGRALGACPTRQQSGARHRGVRSLPPTSGVCAVGGSKREAIERRRTGPRAGSPPSPWGRELARRRALGG